MTLVPGTRLGTWELVAQLGTGGMGQVWRARDLRLRRDVALQVLPDAVARDAAWLARFEREARTLAGVNHPNVVTLHSIEDEDGVRFLTMELVEGEPLDRLVAPGLPLGAEPGPDAARLLFRTPYEVDPSGWDVTADGERFLALGPDAAMRAPSTTVIVDWQAMVRER